MTLKQARCDSAVWILLLHDRQLQEDENRIVNYEAGKIVGWLVTYVDDLLTVAEEDYGMEVLDAVGKKWQCTPIDVLTMEKEMSFLGLRIQLTKNGSFFIHQAHYIRDLLRRKQMQACHGLKIVLDHEECYIQEEEEELARQKEQGQLPNPGRAREAQKVAGELLWLSIRSRAELAYSLSRLSSYVSKNPERAIRMAQRVLRFLKHTADYGMLFAGPKTIENEQRREATPMREHFDEAVILGYSDASFAPDGGKSYGGIIVCVGSSTIFWRASRQSMVTLSTAESELRAMCDTHVKIPMKGRADSLNLSVATGIMIYAAAGL